MNHSKFSIIAKTMVGMPWTFNSSFSSYLSDLRSNNMSLCTGQVVEDDDVAYICTCNYM
jgi:hypothetical protein